MSIEAAGLAQGAPEARGSAYPGMIHIPGGTFRMGSDKHYPEEAPVHRVTVAGFWIDRTPVTNRDFRKFVNAAGYVTFAEIRPDPKDYPGALPHMLKAGSLVFTPPKHAVDLHDWSQWWNFKFGADWRRPYGPRSSISGLDGAGSHTYTKEKIGTRYVMLGIRTLVDPNDPKDVEQVHRLQDAMKIDQASGSGRFEAPNWDSGSQKKIRDALLVLAGTLPDTSAAKPIAAAAARDGFRKGSTHPTACRHFGGRFFSISSDNSCAPSIRVLAISTSCRAISSSWQVRARARHFRDSSKRTLVMSMGACVRA